MHTVKPVALSCLLLNTMLAVGQENEALKRIQVLSAFACAFHNLQLLNNRPVLNTKGKAVFTTWVMVYA
jgi:hypothetical protein